MCAASVQRILGSELQNRRTGEQDTCWASVGGGLLWEQFGVGGGLSRCAAMFGIWEHAVNRQSGLRRVDTASKK